MEWYLLKSEVEKERATTHRARFRVDDLNESILNMRIDCQEKKMENDKKKTKKKTKGKVKINTEKLGNVMFLYIKHWRIGEPSLDAFKVGKIN